jgi:hypothetical protein
LRDSFTGGKLISVQARLLSVQARPAKLLSVQARLLLARPAKMPEMTVSNQLTRREQIVKDCSLQIQREMLKNIKAEKSLFNKRNYAQGSKTKASDYFYLRMERFMTEARLRLLRLGIDDRWVDELINNSVKVCRKNSRGHDGVKS